MTSAVIIVLREVLEAVLIICMLLASSSALGLRFRWLPPALLAGLVGALAYALSLEQISMAFEGFGQEIVNAVLLLMITVLLLAHNILAMREFKAPGVSRLPMLSLAILSATIAMAIVREGSEIYLYVYSYGVVAGDMASVLPGAAIGTGIGFSLGTFIYYSLRTLSARHCLLFSSIMALIVGAGMSSQAALFLAHCLRTGAPSEAMRMAAASVHDLLEATAASGMQELQLVEAQGVFVAPSLRFSVERL